MNPIQAYLDRKRITVDEFAIQIGVTRSGLWRIIHDQRTPLPKTAAAIIRGSNGELTWSDLYEEKFK